MLYRFPKLSLRVAILDASRYLYLSVPDLLCACSRNTTLFSWQCSSLSLRWVSLDSVIRNENDQDRRVAVLKKRCY